MTVHDLIKTLEGVDPNLTVQAFDSQQDQYVDINGVFVMPTSATLLIEY